MLTEAIAAYSVLTWTGMIVFGRSAWRENGDGFALYFGFLSRISLFGSRTRSERTELIVRQPLSELARVEARPGAVVFVGVMIGTVAFDGFSRSSWWLQRIYDIETSFSSFKAAERAAELFNLAGLIIGVLSVVAAYTLAVRSAERIVGRPGAFKGVFLGSLFPIAFVYALAHYFSLLVVQGQFIVPLLSNPYGKDWNLFGTVDWQPNLSELTPNLTWYVQVTALVLGHVCALVVAHDRAVAQTTSSRIALRTQYVMLALVVLFTVGGMWLLSVG